MSEFEKQVVEDLCVLKAQMEQLLGIGQPGRLHALEARVEQHEQSVQRIKGVGAVFGGVMTLVHLAIVYLSGRR